MKNCFECVFRKSDGLWPHTKYSCTNGQQEKMDAFTSENGSKPYKEVGEMVVDCHDYPEGTKRLIHMIELTDNMLNLLKNDDAK